MRDTHAFNIDEINWRAEAKRKYFADARKRNQLLKQKKQVGYRMARPMRIFL